MDVALLVARLGLGVIFFIAGIAKLADLAGSRRAVEAFGVPARHAAAVGTVLSVLEIALAILLVPPGTTRYAAAGLFVLSAGFVAVVGANLARGNTPDCHCFGSLHAERSSWRVVVRDVLLAAAAGAIVAGGSGASLSRWLDDTTSMLLAISTSALTLACGFLLYERRRLLARFPIPASTAGAPSAAASDDDTVGLPIGAEAPAFELSTIDGAPLSLDQLVVRGLPVMLVFSDPGCEACHELLAHVGRWQHDAEGVISIVVLSAGPRAANRRNGLDPGPVPLLVQRAREVADAYRVSSTPSAVVVGPDGNIASETVGGGQAIRDLMLRSIEQAGLAATAVAGGSPSARPALVTRMPAVRLRDLDGRVVELRTLLRQRTLIVFWDPESPHCWQVVDALRAAGPGPLSDGTNLLVVSSGVASPAPADVFAAQSLVDAAALIGRAIGAPGTPAAVVVDQGGTIRSPISIGTAAVLALLRAGDTPRIA